MASFFVSEYLPRSQSSQSSQIYHMLPRGWIFAAGRGGVGTGSLRLWEFTFPYIDTSYLSVGVRKLDTSWYYVSGVNEMFARSHQRNIGHAYAYWILLVTVLVMAKNGHADDFRPAGSQRPLVAACWQLTLGGSQVGQPRQSHPKPQSRRVLRVALRVLKHKKGNPKRMKSRKKMPRCKIYPVLRCIFSVLTERIRKSCNRNLTKFVAC